MEVVSRQAHRLKKSCSKSNTEWSELSLAITELADAVEAIDIEDHGHAISEHLLPLAAELGELLRNIRSKLVSDVCEQLGRIVKTTRLAFTPLANALLEALASTAKASSVAIRNPGFQLFSDVSEYSRYDLQVVQRVYRSSPQERVKSIVLEQLQIVLASWPKGDIEPFFSDMLEIMRRGMLDPSGHVRTACRQAFCSFSDIWQERLDELVLIPSQPARDLLMKEKPHAAITKAIRRKFNIETPKDSRSESIRLRRSAVRRQGSSTVGERDHSIFVDVKESPRRSSQRTVTADPPKRSASPGRGPTRSASPSSVTRTTSSTARSASPSAAVRGASPSRTSTRVASPSRATRDTATGTATARSASPARGQTLAPATDKGHTSASPPPQARNSEYDRYLNSTMLEEKVATTTPQGQIQEPKHSTPSRPQKRVSIVEPPSISHLRDSDWYLQRPLGHHQFSNHDERYSTTHEERHSTATNYSAAEDARHSQLLSSNPSSSPKNRYSADAEKVISHTRPEAFGFNGHSHQFESAKSEGRNDQAQEIDSDTEFSLPARPDWFELPSVRDKVRRESKQSVPDETIHVDSYLDRPIPSSAPAPEPRASANVTQRVRRRFIDQDNEPAEKPRVRDLTEPSDVTHVAAVPVPGDVPTVGIRHSADQRDLDNSDDEPPSVSIDSAFRTTNMATRTPGYDSASSPLSSMDTINQDFFDDEGFDKENVCQPVASAKTDVKMPDALANLNAIRAGMQKLREAHQVELAGNSHKIMPNFTDNRDPKALQAQQTDHQFTGASRPAVSINAEHPQRAAAEHQSLDADLRSGAQPQRQNLPASTALQPVARLPLQTPPIQENPLRRDQQQCQPPVESVQRESKPSTDFVREPKAFAFGHAAPSNQQVPQSYATLGQPPKTAQADKARPRLHHLNDAQNEFKGFPPQKPSAPTRLDNGPPPPQESRRQVPEQDRHMQPAPTNAHSSPPRQQKPFSLSKGLPAYSDNHPLAPTGSKAQSHLDPPHRPQPTASPIAESTPNRRHTVLNPKPEKINAGVANKMVYSFCLVLGTIFGVSGLIQAATKVRDAYEYHNALLNRINQFESSIVESYESVRKMDEKYVVWSEFVRELTEQDESNALHQLESIQVEVEKWQVEMKNDLLEFKRSLSGDIIDAALAHLREPNTTSEASTAAESAP